MFLHTLIMSFYETSTSFDTLKYGNNINRIIILDNLLHHAVVPGLPAVLASRHENCWQHGQHASGPKQKRLRNQRDIAYLELKLEDNACINHKKEPC